MQCNLYYVFQIIILRMVSTGFRCQKHPQHKRLRTAAWGSTDAEVPLLGWPQQTVAEGGHRGWTERLASGKHSIKRKHEAERPMEDKTVTMRTRIPALLRLSCISCDWISRHCSHMSIEINTSFTWASSMGFCCLQPNHLQTRKMSSFGSWIHTRLLGNIRHTAWSIFMVIKCNLSLTGALNSNGQAPCACFPGPDAELGWNKKTPV